MPRAAPSVPIDAYVLDVLLRDLVGHDHQPAAFLVYLHLFGLSVRGHWRPVAASLRDIAEATGLSKSAVQAAMKILRRRELITTRRAHATATPRHRVRRHWITRKK
jgi:DNA-binding MarR family transcriptional regulator